MAKLVKPDAVVWKGDSSLPRECQGIRVLGAPIGTPEYVADQLAHNSREQETLFTRIPTVQDTQVCWLLLLMCASTRANFWLRMIRPDQTLQYAERNDAAVWGCLCAILGSPGVPADAQVTASFPLSMGGLGLASAVRSSVAAHWSSWADCIKMVRDRHPIVADVIMRGIDHHPALCFDAVRTCEHALVDVGLEIPSWREMSESPPARKAHPQPNGPKFGWQHRANMSLEEQRFATHWAELSQPVKALCRSQRGPLASVALTALPTSRATRIEQQPFAFGCVVFACPFSPPAACSRVGVLGKRGFPLECAAAQVCREAGGRVSNLFVRDLDLAAFNALDNRRVEVIADGLPVAWCTTGHRHHPRVPTARRRFSTRKSCRPQRFSFARRRKERTYPELTGEAGRARLVVLAAEVGGRWSEETAQFLRGLAKARADSVPPLLQGRVKAAWLRRWNSLLACSATRAFAESLLETRPVPRIGAEGCLFVSASQWSAGFPSYSVFKKKIAVALLVKSTGISVLS